MNGEMIPDKYDKEAAALLPCLAEEYIETDGNCLTVPYLHPCPHCVVRPAVAAKLRADGERIAALEIDRDQLRAVACPQHDYEVLGYKQEIAALEAEVARRDNDRIASVDREQDTRLERDALAERVKRAEADRDGYNQQQGEFRNMYEMEKERVRLLRCIARPICTQCGRSWHDSACGPTHALICAALAEKGKP